jgi:hypothetical protein
MFYEDDLFHPNNENNSMINHHYIPDDDTINSGSTRNRATNVRQLNILENYKKLDSNYHVVTKMVNNKKKQVEVYTSPITPGAQIRDAITGSRFPLLKIGSFCEDLFFKVKIANGSLNKDDGSLFFDSPEAYERHMLASVATEDKQRWSVKFAIARQRYLE